MHCSIWIRSFLKSKVQPPPPGGSVGLSERPKVQASPPGGSVGHLEKSKVQHPPEVQETLQRCSERTKKGLFSEGFTGDLHAISTRLEARLWTFKRSKVQPPPTGGSVGPMQRSKHQGPTTPFERVDWTFQPVQAPWWGVPYTRGGCYKVTLV